MDYSADRFEQLEQELWRLRGVEYDLEQARAHIAELEASMEAKAQIATEAGKMEEVAKDLLEIERIDRKKYAEEAKRLRDEIGVLQQTIERMKVGLDRYARHEHMSDNYGFEVVGEIPTAGRGKRRGWRLNS